MHQLRALSLAVLIALLVAPSISAQTAPSAPGSPGSAATAPPATLGDENDYEEDLKSVAVARLWATGATAAGLGLGIATDDIIVALPGIMFGPAAGSFYARDDRRAWRGAGIRSGALFVGSAIVSLRDPSGSNDIQQGGIALATLLTITMSGIIDIVRTSATSVEEHNEQVRAGETASVSLAPWADPLEGRPGLQLTLRF